ncbi:MAG: hypothetical protein HS112_00370 [Zoogloeaceae bacterium]|nr:hypothetical protein [Zoogloeaceae bacterium]
MAAAFSKDDFRRVWLSLAAALVMAAIGAAAVFAATQLRQAEAKSKAAAQAQRMESQRRLAQARDEEQEIKKKIASYNALANRGILGEEHRLDWVEQIRAIKTERKLFDVQYEFAPQKPVDAALLPGASGNYEFLTSTMQLRMKLLHEEDLLNFLADLRDQAQAYIRVRSCDVTRLPKQSGEIGALPPQLDADCSIDWITIRERNGA